MRAFSPTMDGQDRFGGGLKSEEDRLRMRGSMDPASTMFWDDIDDNRKGKTLMAGAGKGILFKGSVLVCLNMLTYDLSKI